MARKKTFFAEWFIRDLGERLDAHRKRQQELHPGLTLTGMYNVLVKLRSEEPLNAIGGFGLWI